MISVMHSAKDAALTLGECLKALLTQEGLLDFELIMK